MAEPTLMVIFGATGDLAKRKLLPSIYNLARQRLLPPGFAVLGAAMDDISEEEFRDRAKQSVTQFSRIQPVDEEVLKDFLGNLFYLPVKFDDAGAFKRLKARLEELGNQRHTGGNVTFYCAVPPPVYPELVQQLGAAGLAK